MLSCKGLILISRLGKRKLNIQIVILFHKAEENTGNISIPYCLPIIRAIKGVLELEISF